jgi:hypothetical protein
MVSLGFVGWGELGDRLELEACPELSRRDDLAVDDQVCDVFADDLAFVDHGQAFLGLEGDAAQGQFMLQCSLVDGFEACKSSFLVLLDSVGGLEAGRVSYHDFPNRGAGRAERTGVVPRFSKSWGWAGGEDGRRTTIFQIVGLGRRRGRFGKSSYGLRPAALRCAHRTTIFQIG